ncbi:aspartyl/asparaginyl beta-hydroxylase domain-containing protein [Botrimarina mediterranea]|uniref:Aspartyl/Asparaginyl beta-hydroxylase n=1 Tax=Botrimarina mediterranea TaxID=2528022 RepID=A0A518K7E1_9BACT|nr:aspartyl/asparaginyl beta-hydroxylase domain-containing protein [Botrimarina mediterranea]QDV73708.1 Aspartyl/Asparaginyl beta-hydroxylase [Botrimarina mediterranea]QDV78298.1 Aspartyl/Asparaginyl beta-hydroxylase [Planctomycetes bacterium K2D]
MSEECRGAEYDTQDEAKGRLGDGIDSPTSIGSAINCWTLFRKVGKRACIPILALVFVPIPFACLVVFGVLDLCRNRNLSRGVVNRYFFGNGLLTWTLSPLNVALDLLCLPYRNPGIFTFEQLPKAYREEIDYIIEHALREGLAARVSDLVGEQQRGMLMYRWYGRNYPTSLQLPAYCRRFRFVQTIGVSVFNGRQSTSLHFGPLRATVRVLYNIGDVSARNAYIDVGPTRHYWADGRLFIFDDTLQHRSVNEGEELRLCLFMDVLRPSMAPFVLRVAVWCVRVTVSPVRRIFYKNWEFLK